MQKWTVVKVNCDDCGSYLWARQRSPQYPKINPINCRMCRRPLGDMQWREIAAVMAETEIGALQKAKEIIKERIKNEKD